MKRSGKNQTVRTTLRPLPEEMTGLDQAFLKRASVWTPPDPESLSTRERNKLVRQLRDGASNLTRMADRLEGKEVGE